MRRPGARPFLPLIALLSLAALVAAVVAGPPLLRAGPGDDARSLARWLASHPSDWLTAARLTERSLDAESEQRVRAWRQLHALAKRLAPSQRNADAAFVRAGLFHWYELSEADRGRVLSAVEPLMKDPAVWRDLHEPLWRLTRDLKLLRRLAPRTSDAAAALKKIAVEHGLFEHYRELREDERRLRLSEMRNLASRQKTAELLRLLPSPLRVWDRDLVEQALAALARHRGEAPIPQHLVAFVALHGARSQEVLAPLVGDPSYPALLRARLSIRLGNDEWVRRLETQADARSGEWAAYLEERAVDEARQGRASAADAYLDRAATGALTPSLLSAAAEVARLLRRPADQARYEQQLRAAGAELRWSGTCGPRELCVSAVARTATPELNVTLSVSQSDQVAPYVEIFVDDRLVVEGPVSETLTAMLRPGTGRHVVELRLANPATRGPAQRRLRIS